MNNSIGIKRAYVIIALAAVIMISMLLFPYKAMAKEGGQVKSTSAEDRIESYDLVIIEDEKVALAASPFEEPHSYGYIIYIVSILCLTVAFFEYRMWYLACLERVNSLNSLTNSYSDKEISGAYNFLRPFKLLQLREELENIAASKLMYINQ